MEDSTKDKIQGNANQASGAVKQKVGEATNNPRHARRGRDGETQGQGAGKGRRHQKGVRELTFIKTGRLFCRRALPRARRSGFWRWQRKDEIASPGKRRVQSRSAWQTDLKAVTIYTDGACSGNPGRGGYGVVLIHAEQRKELAGGFRLTTNNRMEIIAAITGLQSLKERCAVKLHTDSRYVVDSITKGWAKSWRAKNWRMPGGDTRPNADLWVQLLDQCARHEAQFIWVRGHAGNRENNRCDELAVQAARGEDLPTDAGYRQAAAARDLTLI